MIYMGINDMYTERSVERFNLFNEYSVLVVISVYTCFSDFVPLLETRINIGYSYIGFSSCIIIVDFGIVVFNSLKSALKNIKLRKL